MEDVAERKMRAHERGVAVLSKLAVSFDVTLRDVDQERWMVLLTLSRDIDMASLQGGFYAGDCHRALLAGQAYEGFVPRELAQRFKSMHESSDIEGQEFLDDFPHQISRHAVTIRQQRLEHSDVASRNIDHKSKITDFEIALEDDARYRAASLALPLVGPVEDEALHRKENANRVRYNTWLQDFYVAYEHLGALGHAERDRKKGRHRVEPVGGQAFSQAWVTCRSLVRCLNRGMPRTNAILLTHGAARISRKLVGRL